MAACCSSCDSCGAFLPFCLTGGDAAGCASSHSRGCGRGAGAAWAFACRWLSGHVLEISFALDRCCCVAGGVSAGAAACLCLGPCDDAVTTAAVGLDMA